MAWIHTYDDGLDLSVITATGPLSTLDLSAAIIEAAAHSKFHSSSRLLYDYVQLDENAAPLDVMFSERHDRYLTASFRRAFLVHQSRLGQFAAFSVSCRPIGQVRIFADRESALDWLHDGTPPWRKLI